VSGAGSSLVTGQQGRSHGGHDDCSSDSHHHLQHQHNEEVQSTDKSQGQSQRQNQGKSLATLGQHPTSSATGGSSGAKSAGLAAAGVKAVGDGKSGNDSSSADTSLLGNTSITKPLVLFDRTDPEFDEDSDPDGDLDL
jgi:hypothetical protein